MSEPAVTGSLGREASDPYCLSPGEADRLLRAAPWRRFVVVGDSLAEGLGDPCPGYATASWPDRTAAALRRQQPQAALVNLGRRDLRAAQVRATQVGPALEFGPDLAAVVCGGNDLLVRAFDPAPVVAELEAVVAALRDAGADVVTYTLLDGTAAWPELTPIRSRLEQLNAGVRAVSERHGALLVDLWRHEICAQRDAYSADMKHASMRGHAVIAAETVRRLGQHLEDRRRTGARATGTDRHHDARSNRS